MDTGLYSATMAFCQNAIFTVTLSLKQDGFILCQVSHQGLAMK